MSATLWFDTNNSRDSEPGFESDWQPSRLSFSTITAETSDKDKLTIWLNRFLSSSGMSYAYKAVICSAGQEYELHFPHDVKAYLDTLDTLESTIMSTQSISNETPSATSETPNPHAPLATVSIKRDKQTNALTLQIDAKPFHDLLDSIGVINNGGTYISQPSAAFNVVRENELSTKLFLKREYPVVANLSAIWDTPPTIDRLEAICMSAQSVMRKILNHYQPIDIKVTIHKRMVG